MEKEPNLKHEKSSLEQEKEKMLAYYDRYGYITDAITEKELDSEYDGNQDEFFRRHENLSPEANLDYAHGRIGWIDADTDLEEYNRRIKEQM